MKKGVWSYATKDEKQSMNEVGQYINHLQSISEALEREIASLTNFKNNLDKKLHEATMILSRVSFRFADVVKERKERDEKTTY